MIIKDNLTGITARVFDGRLTTQAVTQGIGSYQSLQKGYTFAVTSQDTEPNSGTKNVFAITNTGSKLLLMERFTLQLVYPTTSLPATDEYVSLYIGAKGITGGDAVTAANANATSNYAGNHEIKKNGFSITTEGTKFCQTYPLNGWPYELTLDGMMILGQNDAFVVKVSSGSSNTDGIIAIKTCFLYTDTIDG